MSVQRSTTGDEVGYLLLEDCELMLLTEKSNLETQEWIDVDFRGVLGNHDDDENDICTRGNVVLEQRRDSLVLLSTLPRFDGTMQDVVHSSRRCPSCCTSSKKTNRSDASLVLGLAMTCQEHAHIAIETMQVLLFKCSNKNDVEKSDTVRAAFLITFSMPWLEKEKKAKQKAMPPSTQLLFALLRSDWDYLDSPLLTKKQSRQHFRSDGSLFEETLFPSKLSLEELYSRIRGLQVKEEKVPTDNSSSQLSTIPLEVLQYNIAPFLRARTLNSLRCTCSDIKDALSAVVPGLKLRLYKHQVTSLEWMRSRETREWSENDILDGHDGDCHRAVTAGATVLLQSRTTRRRYRLDTMFGMPCDTDRDLKYLSRKVARGGLLCDDPGLGKTITVLSLILQTMGLSSEEEADSTADVTDNETEEKIFGAYWRGCVAPVFQRQGMNRVSKQAQRMDVNRWFRLPVSKEAYPDYYEVIKKPMCFQQIARQIEKGSYDNDFESYVSDVELIFRNGMDYNPADDPVYELAEDMLGEFEEAVRAFKEKQLRSATKSFSNPNARPNNAVAAILNRQIRKKYVESLIPSAATLLVVPDPLLAHWVEQINMHVNFRYCTTLEPVVFEFKSYDAKTRERMKQLRLNACVLKTHAPMIFVDQKGTTALPDPDFLAIFSVVLTTTKRFVNEWKNGSFEEELKREDGDASPYVMYRMNAQENSACPLLKIHWTRMVVDEGHSMGRGKQNNAILFASWISASRRWSMTGTPTPQTTSRSGLTNLLGLMGFLKHEFFSRRRDGDKVWLQLSRAWNSSSLAAFYRLRSLLGVLMIRHTKLDIVELPPPQRERVWLDMSQEEVKAYNTMVSAVQQNLFLTSMESKTSGMQDSFLHKSQIRSARQVFQNLRLSSTGGYRVRLKITEANWNETVWMLRELHKLSGIKLQLVENYMHRVVTEELSSCMHCGLQVMTLLVLPCGDLLCSQCMKTTKTRCCLVCEDVFDPDDLQRLQPGMEYEWYDEQEKEKKAERAEHEEVPVIPVANDALVPMNLAGQVALQPALINRRTNKKGDGHDCEYDVAAMDGKCKLCHEEHDECVMMEVGSRCSVCHRLSQPCPQDESKFSYLVTRLNQICARSKGSGKVFSPAAARFTGEQVVMTEGRRPKVIVFSQYRKVLNLVGNRLILRYGAGAVAEYWGSYRKQELAKFTMNNDCFCMLLSNDGSEGLDLSFVTHIFLMEELWDKSLEDQVVARAWRMGAKGHVEVINILASDSVEPLMTKANQRLSDKTESESTKDAGKDAARSKMVYVLDNIKFARVQNDATPVSKRKVGGDDEKTKKKPRVRFAE